MLATNLKRIAACARLSPDDGLKSLLGIDLESGNSVSIELFFFLPKTLRAEAHLCNFLGDVEIDVLE